MLLYILNARKHFNIQLTEAVHHLQRKHAHSQEILEICNYNSKTNCHMGINNNHNPPCCHCEQPYYAIGFLCINIHIVSYYFYIAIYFNLIEF